MNDYHREPHECPKCKFSFDPNEDFNCMHCGRGVPDRVLFCSMQCAYRHDYYSEKEWNYQNEQAELESLREVFRAAEKVFDWLEAVAKHPNSAIELDATHLGLLKACNEHKEKFKAGDQSTST